jgi:hypothetical protein
MSTVVRCLVLSALLASSALATDKEIPFPVRKSTTASRDGATYIVKGRQRLRKGVTICVKQNTRILGRGKDPTLEVAGTLIIEAQPRQEVVIENLRIEPAKQFQGIRIEWARMLSGSIEVPEQGSVTGPLSIDCTTVLGPVRLAFAAGKVRLLRSEFQGPVTIIGVPPADKTVANLDVRIYNCCYDRKRTTKLNGGFFRGLRVARARDVVVRANRLWYGSHRFEDCCALMFDGNAVFGSTLFRQTRPGRFRRPRLKNCDFYGGLIVFEAPKVAKPGTVVLEKCWFNDITDPNRILKERVRDCRHNPACKVKARLSRIHKQPVGIGGRERR